MSQYGQGGKIVLERDYDRERFAFGDNWSKFLSHIDGERIAESERGLLDMLGPDSLNGQTFLDIGSGSGLSSLAARRLGARVHSFDYDPASVSCTNELRRRYFPGDRQWTVEQGSVLDETFMRSLGKFDVVYSWGVLHHTGDLWTALGRAAEAVSLGGTLFVAIYNDSGVASRLWRFEKRLYVRSPAPIRLLLIAAIGGALELRHAAERVARGGGPLLFKHWRDRKRTRGMSVWYNLVDWVGGYPYEFAKPGQVFSFLRPRGFELEVMETYNGSGPNNQYVFRKTGAPDSRASMETAGAQTPPPMRPQVSGA